MSSFEKPGVPVWVKIGAAVVALLVLVVLIIVLVSPSSPSQKATGSTLPPVSAGPTTTSARTLVPPSTLAAGSVDARGGIGVTPGTQAPVTLPPTTAAPVPHGLRLATTAELTAIAADVPPPTGQSIDAVMVAISDPHWGVLHVAAGAGKAQEYVLITLTGGKWAPVDSGYPSMPCDTKASTNVQLDVGPLMAACPVANPNGA